MTMSDARMATTDAPQSWNFDLDHVVVAYVTDGAEANAIINEIIADAVGGLDRGRLETAPRPAEAARLRQLRDATAGAAARSPRWSRPRPIRPGSPAEAQFGKNEAALRLCCQGRPRPASCRHPAVAALWRRQARCSDRSRPHRARQSCSASTIFASSPTMPASIWVSWPCMASSPPRSIARCKPAG